MSNPLPLDPALDDLCEVAGAPDSPWALAWEVMAAAGRTTPWAARRAFYETATLQLYPRVHSGYVPKAQRNASTHGLYANGLKSDPPTDPNLKIKAAARLMGYVC